MAAAGGEDSFGVAVGFGTAFEDKFECCLKGETLIEMGRYVAIVGIAGVLAVDDGGHSFERAADLFFAG